MGRENRRKTQDSNKMILYISIGIVILSIIVFALFMYSKSLNEDVKNSTMSLEKMTKIAEENSKSNTENTQSASTEIGKTVEESKNEIKGNMTNENNMETNINNEKNNNISKVNSNNIEKTQNQSQKEENKETKKELNFQKPVDGDIVKEYARDNLIYSKTLDEWTTHSGIDIKAEKTTIVKTAEDGVIKSIKNDPRYGLTIVVEHENNFQTIYSNLLTSEFVVEGETVKKGQAIGTVGNTAIFEVADEAHLHFEILKDSLPVDPNIYIK